MVGFDISAEKYDKSFTKSAIGIYQRKQVWRQLNKVLNSRKKLHILEINCGTGEDAKMMALKGHNVIATDISSKMIDEAKRKAGDIVDFKVCDFRQLEILNNQEFDLIFSNFGGLNCVNESDLKEVVNNVSQMLSTNGKFIAIIMGTSSVWEFFYFALKLNFKNSVRRRSFAVANVDGELINTWYYTPKRVQKLAPRRLRYETKLPIGLFVPPSYLNRFFKKHPSCLKVLYWLDNKIGRFKWQSNLADHFLIQFGRA